MKKVMLLVALLFAVALTGYAQVSTDLPPASVTVQSAFDEIVTALKSQTNLLVAPHVLYAPKCQDKWGGGLAVLVPLSKYAHAGPRFTWLNGGAWLVDGTATLQLPIHPFKFWPKFVITPFATAGITTVASGMQVLGKTIPGKVHDLESGTTGGVYGWGGNITFYSSKDNKGPISEAGVFIAQEKWSPLPGYVYSGGVQCMIHW